MRLRYATASCWVTLTEKVTGGGVCSVAPTTQ